MFIDTHCHIHDDDYPLDGSTVFEDASDVDSVICVGTNARSSERAVEYAQKHTAAWAALGLHPHDSQDSADIDSRLELLASNSRVIAVGECGLDYFYMNSDAAQQKIALIAQLDLAQRHSLPMIFHIRGSKEDQNDAFVDFWDIYDQYNLPGVVHSFSAGNTQLEDILKRDLYVGLNGIITFMNSEEQLDVIRRIPTEKIVLETDAPYLTPVPFRGKINEPKFLGETAAFLVRLKDSSINEVAEATTANAQRLFRI